MRWCARPMFQYHVAPPRCKEASQVNSTSWKSRGRNAIIAEPLKCGKKVNDQSISDSISVVTGKRDCVADKLRNWFKRHDINILPDRMHAATNDSFPSNDCNCCHVKVKNCVHCNNSDWMSDKWSSGSSKSICSVSTRIPRQIILVEGWQSFSGDDAIPVHRINLEDEQTWNEHLRDVQLRKNCLSRHQWYNLPW